MNNKDYTLITNAIADYQGILPLEKRIHIETFVTLYLIPKLKEDNDKFNTEMFLKSSFNRPY